MQRVQRVQKGLNCKSKKRESAKKRKKIPRKSGEFVFFSVFGSVDALCYHCVRNLLEAREVCARDEVVIHTVGL